MNNIAQKLHTAPTTFPITKEIAKQNLRLDELDDDDSLLNIYIAAATDLVEVYTQRRLMTQTWNLFLDDFPGASCEFRNGVIFLPYPPLQSVTHVKYYDSQGVLTTLTNVTDYVIDDISEPSQIVPAQTKIWPSVETDRINAVEVRFVCGYTSAALIPASIRQALLFLIAHFYENRNAVNPLELKEIPFGIKSLLYPYRDMRFS